VAGTFAVCAALLFVILAGTSAGSRALGFCPPDRITAIFCGSKKTLASGVPMAQLIFAGHAELSLILLPILIYHPLQLVVCGWLASRWAGRAASSTAK
jgi:sodium/bile acid cotransporter 7